MNLSQRVKDLVLQNDMDYVGIAPVDRFINAPAGHKPTDLLPGAQSVVSISIKINKGAQLTMIRGFAHRELRHLTFSYRWFAYGLANWYFMDRVALMVTKLLEEEGHVALPVVASGVGYAQEPLRLHRFSHRHAAVAAGLGEIGWNGVCLTPDNGPRQRFVSVITTANLEPDPMYSGPKLCDVEKCKELGQGMQLCVKTCPMHAFLREGKKEVVIGGIRMEYANMNFTACTKVHPAFVDNPNKYAPPPLKAEFESRLELERIIYRRGHACGFCLFVCPAGANNGLSDLIELELKRRS